MNSWEIILSTNLVIAALSIFFGIKVNANKICLLGILQIILCAVIYSVNFNTDTLDPCQQALHTSATGNKIGINHIPLHILAKTDTSQLYQDKALTQKTGVMKPNELYFVFEQTPKTWQIGRKEDSYPTDRQWVKKQQTYCWASRKTLNINTPVAIYATQAAAEAAKTPLEHYQYRYKKHTRQSPRSANRQTTALPVIEQQGDYWSFIKPELTDTGYYPQNWLKRERNKTTIETRLRLTRRTFEINLTYVNKLIANWRNKDQKPAKQQNHYDPCGLPMQAISSKAEKNSINERYINLLKISSSETDWDSQDEIYLNKASICQLTSLKAQGHTEDSIVLGNGRKIATTFKKGLLIIVMVNALMLFYLLLKPIKRLIQQARLALLEKHKQLAAETINAQMVTIESGRFEMGSDDGGIDQTPVHTVRINQNYELGRYPVTQALWKKVMGENPSYFKGPNKPVENVSWGDVQSFIQKLNQQTGLNYRLPTEAEWEYACRSGGKDQKYSGSNHCDEVAWFGSNSGGRTHKVGQKQANGLGLYDMSGNVYEWVQDRYDPGYYSNSPSDDPKGPSDGSLFVFRGGSWYSDADDLRSANRYGDNYDYHNLYLGFRLARSYKKEQEIQVAINEQEQKKLAVPEKQEQLAQESINALEMITILSGRFEMGSDDGYSDETPVHTVHISQNYELGKYPVTQALWENVMGENPSDFEDPNNPVENVSWDDVQRFIQKLNQQTGLNYRLPTEAEWEYACRSGGKDQTYSGSNNYDEVAWYHSNSGDRPRLSKSDF